MKNSITALLALVLLAAGSAASAQTEKFTAIFGGKSVGHLDADVKGNDVHIDFDVKNNGRGPTIAETIRLDANGLPTAWTITGTLTFGNKVNERFGLSGQRA